MVQCQDGDNLLPFPSTAHGYGKCFSAQEKKKNRNKNIFREGKITACCKNKKKTNFYLILFISKLLKLNARISTESALQLAWTICQHTPLWRACCHSVSLPPYSFKPPTHRVPAMCCKYVAQRIVIWTPGEITQLLQMFQYKKWRCLDADHST